MAMSDLDPVVLTCLLCPLRDLVVRAWGEPTPEVERILNEVENLCRVDEGTDHLIERARRLALGTVEPGVADLVKPHLPLVSIFSNLSLVLAGDRQAPEQVGIIAPDLLAEEPVYPELVSLAGVSEHALTAENYRTHMKSFLGELNEVLASGQLRPNTATVLMQKYGTYVPAEVVGLPGAQDQDIRLPDVPISIRCKLTAAIASCLYRGDTACSSPYRYVAGDFSGVQDFVYTISSRGALKTLRARSFYLELLTTHITHRLVRELALTPANILFAGGGRFALLVPGTEKAVTILDGVRRGFNRWLLNGHGAGLYLVMEWTELGDSDFSGGTAGESLSEKLAPVFDRIGDAKKKRFAYLDKADQNALFIPFLPERLGNPHRESQGEWGPKKCILCGMGNQHIHASVEVKTRLGDTKTEEVDGCEICLPTGEWPKGECRICHSESAFLVPLPEPGWEENENWVPVCTLCHALYHFGEHLAMREGRYIVRSDKPVPAKAVVPIEESYYYLLLDQDARAWWNTGDMLDAWLLNNLEARQYSRENLWPLLVARHQPAQEILDFHELADWSVGFPRIGVLRMDVDNLGDLFNKGLQAGPVVLFPSGSHSLQGTADFSRWMTLSQQMDVFFKWHLNALCKGQGIQGGIDTVSDFDPSDAYLGTQGRKVSIVYSGGDDLFLVGAWSDVVELAFDVRRSFCAFCAGNPDVDISAGMIVTEEHYPIHLMAEESHKALKRAKSHIVPAGEHTLEKSSISLFWTEMLRGDKAVEPVFRWKKGVGADEPDGSDILRLVKLFLKFRKPGSRLTLSMSPAERRLELKLPRAFLYDLLSLIDVYCRRGKLYLPRMAYALGRRESQESTLLEEWDLLKNTLIQPVTIRYLLPAVTWVDFLMRAKSMEEEGS